MQERIPSLSQHTPGLWPWRGIWTTSLCFLGCRPVNWEHRVSPTASYSLDMHLRAFTLLRHRNGICGSKVPCFRKKHWDFGGYASKQMQAAQKLLTQVKTLLLRCFWWTWTCPNCQELPHFRKTGVIRQYYWKANFELRMRRRGCLPGTKFRLPTAEMHCHSYTETLHLHQLACSWMEHFVSENVSVASNTTKSTHVSVLWTCSKYHLQPFPLSQTHRVGSIQKRFTGLWNFPARGRNTWHTQLDWQEHVWTYVSVGAY